MSDLRQTLRSLSEKYDHPSWDVGGPPKTVNLLRRSIATLLAAIDDAELCEPELRLACVTVTQWNIDLIREIEQEIARLDPRFPCVQIPTRRGH